MKHRRCPIGFLPGLLAAVFLFAVPAAPALDGAVNRGTPSKSWAGSAALSGGHLERSPAPGGLAERIDAYLKPFVETNNFTGVVLVARGGRILFQKGYGLADVEHDVPNTPKTRFHIASLSKAFTAVAILLLEERGRLATADPVSKFLPDYPSGDKIRLEHLLTHSSGIPNVNNFPEYDRESFFPHTTAGIVAMFKDKPLEFEPGTRFRYSNSNYNILALIIETVSGQRYGEFLRTNIFGPLGLASTIHNGDAAALIKDRAVGLEPEGLRGLKLAPRIDWSIKTGNGSLVTSAADLALFARALFEARLLRPESLSKILRPGEAFPYGWTDRERAGRKVKGSGGRSPGFVSSLDYVLEDGTAIIVLSNSYSPVTQDPIAGDIGAIVYGRAIRPPLMTPVAPRPGESAALAGTYRMPDDYFIPGVTLTLADRGGYLEARWANGAMTVIYSVGDGEYLDRTFWARVRFTRDAEGRVTGFVYNLTREFMARRLGQ